MRNDPVSLVRLAALLAAVLPLVCGAQAAFAERSYQVEVVVFAQPPGTSVELPPQRRAPLAADASDAVDPADPADEDPVAESGAPLTQLPSGFAPPRDPLVLRNVAARLNTGGYRLLWHQAWIQPPLDGAAGLNLLATLGKGPVTPGLSGAISLSVNRFLHLGVELELGSAAGLEAELRQRRRVRPGVDQYFDHPRIGVIAIVTEVPEQAGQSASAP